MKNKYPTVDHQFDVWHMAKSITKQVNTASKRRDCENFRPRIKSITNPFWWASDTCGGSTGQLKVIVYKKTSYSFIRDVDLIKQLVINVAISIQNKVAASHL